MRDGKQEPGEMLLQVKGEGGENVKGKEYSLLPAKQVTTVFLVTDHDSGYHFHALVIFHACARPTITPARFSNTHIASTFSLL